MLVLMRFDDDRGATLQDLRTVLGMLDPQPGFLWGAVCRSPDDPRQWLLATAWRDAGSMRRGIGSFDAKAALGPLQTSAAPGSGVFEILAEHSEEEKRFGRSDRAADADRTGPGQ